MPARKAGTPRILLVEHTLGTVPNGRGIAGGGHVGCEQSNPLDIAASRRLCLSQQFKLPQAIKDLVPTGNCRGRFSLFFGVSVGRSAQRSVLALRTGNLDHHRNLAEQVFRNPLAGAARPCRNWSRSS